MSWSVSALGKPAAVAAKLELDFKRISKMEEPEQSVKDNAAASVAATLAAYPPNMLVRVEASGSQYSPSGAAAVERISTHSLKIENLGPIIE